MSYSKLSTPFFVLWQQNAWFLLLANRWKRQFYASKANLVPSHRSRRKWLLSLSRRELIRGSIQGVRDSQRLLPLLHRPPTLETENWCYNDSVCEIWGVCSTAGEDFR